MKEEIQQKYMQFQMIQQQMQQIQKQLEMFTHQGEELQALSESLEALKTIKPGSPARIPLSGGIFVEGTLTNSQQLLVNIGCNIAVKKSVDDTIEVVKKQASEVTQHHEELAGHLGTFAKKAEEMQQELQYIMEKEQNEEK
jgi:prefoldin alpha subunit